MHFADVMGVSSATVIEISHQSSDHLTDKL